ncbi:hypothetical protein AVEN_174565-1 [Araneus ventricosus]|uniref:CCHC-type domain-containing protein n=1 Tax=Araneus ventricosus TaxID=182803 RepID=A0A4Y2UUX7_ARAVE|nr:hypothetical protein AVEN_174565-1 [Araneus ventricosus]
MRCGEEGHKLSDCAGELSCGNCQTLNLRLQKKSTLNMLLEAGNEKYIFVSWILLEEERITVKMVFMFSNPTSLFRGSLLNFNHCTAASLQLEHDILRLDLDIIFMTEP